MLAGTQKPMLGTKSNRAHPLAKGVRGSWLFNEGVGNVAYDTSGYDNHGTLTNIAAPPTTASGWNPGRKGHTIAFDGSSDYIDCDNYDSLDILDAITINTWVKTTNIGTLQYIVSKYKSVDGYRSYGLFLSAANKPKFVLSQTGIGAGISLEATDAISQNIWHYIVGTFDGDVMNLYVDNLVKSSDVALTEIHSNNQPVYIGIYGNQSSFPFEGSIDVVSIHNRALCAEEIKWLYHAPYCMFERGELLL